MRRDYIEALCGEWTKARTVASTAWHLVAAVASGIGLSVVVCALARAGIGAGQDSTKSALSGLQLAQAPLALCGVQLITGEYRSGLIHTSLAAVPRRTMFVAAKVTVILGLTLAAATVTMAGALLVTRTEPNPHVVLSATLHVIYVGILSSGVGFLVRDTAFADALVLGVLYVLPLVSRLR
ncbi:hypothetical protein [Catenulispora subtropica]|uniref:Uncharacterized protein n=1 Tax=Catenulispora subtropica TaxID=450798 RepID=A0ABP5DL83_9ACTN